MDGDFGGFVLTFEVLSPVNRPSGDIDHKPWDGPFSSSRDLSTSLLLNRPTTTHVVVWWRSSTTVTDSFRPATVYSWGKKKKKEREIFIWRWVTPVLINWRLLISFFPFGKFVFVILSKGLWGVKTRVEVEPEPTYFQSTYSTSVSVLVVLGSLKDLRKDEPWSPVWCRTVSLCDPCRCHEGNGSKSECDKENSEKIRFCAFIQNPIST